MSATDGPWVRFFPSDWLAGTRGMTATETGVYITLVCLMYEKEGPVTRDDARQARLCGLPLVTYRKVIDVLIEDEKITDEGGALFNNRVSVELKKRFEFSEAGRKGAQARWDKKDNENNGPKIRPQKDSSPPPDANHNHNHIEVGSLHSPTAREPDDADLLEAAFQDWNTLADHAGLPKATTLNVKRKAALRQRLKECGGREGWQDALRLIRQSAFLMGENDSGFTATLDFVLQASSFTKLREGNYNRRGNGPAPKRNGLADIEAKLREEIQNEGFDGSQSTDLEIVPGVPRGRQ